MKYAPIGTNVDGTTSVRLFMDDGNTYDRNFTVHVPSFEEVLDSLVAPAMREYVDKPPSVEVLVDPNVPISLVASPDEPAAVPEDATEVALDTIEG